MLENKSFGWTGYAQRSMAPAFKSLSFKHQPAKFPTKVAKPRSKTYGAILRHKSPTKTTYALVQGRYTGKWSFPKGHSRDGETALECTEREVYEETGIKQLPTPTQFLHVGYGNYYLFDFSEEITLIPSDTNEIMDTCWVSLEEMSKLDLNSDVNYFKRTQPL
jgi:8-oxo-dGTP pyrophosphatase MutT (NUDIX family)